MKNKNYPYYDVPFVNDMKELLDYCAGHYGDKTAFWHGKGDKEIHHSYIDVRKDVAAFATYLHFVGFAGKHIAILGENSYEWIVAYFAVVNMGGVVVPIDKELDVESITALLKRADVDLLIHTKAYTEEAAATGFKTLSLKDTEEYISSGKKMIDEGNAAYSDYSVDKKAMCAIVFTSGTTGEPKGVMLSHKSLTSDAINAGRVVNMYGTSLLVLPIYHTFAFTAGVLGMLLKSAPIFINSSIKRLTKDIKQSKPQNMILVPLIVQAMCRTINESIDNSGKRNIFNLFVKVSCFFRKIGLDFRRVLFRSVLAEFGGNLDRIICGGAHLDQPEIDLLDSIGIQVLNGYGITECSPIVAGNWTDCTRANSLGRVLPDYKIRIVDDEIQTAGDNIMLGYYKDEESTKNVFDGEWFKTGDLGYLDDDGFLYLTGRVKNLIILSNGKNVSPEELEAIISRVDGVQEVIVYGKGDCITAEIYPKDSNMALSEEIKQSVLALNKSLPKYKQIADFIFRDTEFEKTATKKIKRQ